MTPPTGATTRPARPARTAVPRRVSGPAGPPVATAAAAAAPALPETPSPARGPRPVRPPAPRAVPRRRRRSAPGVAPRLGGAVARVPDARLLDRLIRGRVWIVVVAFALIGIVAMRLALLELNTGIGRALEHEQLLQRENASLEYKVSSASAADTVEATAESLGMVAAPPGAITFLSASGPAVSRADLSALATPVSSSASTTASSDGATAAGTATATTATTDTATTYTPVGG